MITEHYGRMAMHFTPVKRGKRYVGMTADGVFYPAEKDGLFSYGSVKRYSRLTKVWAEPWSSKVQVWFNESDWGVMPQHEALNKAKKEARKGGRSGKWDWRLSPHRNIYGEHVIFIWTEEIRL